AGVQPGPPRSPEAHIQGDLEEAPMDAGKGGQDFSRRQVLSTAGLAAVAVPLAANGKFGAGRRAAALVRRAGKAGAPQPEQLHVQFGADAAQQVAVSWATPAQVSMPRLRLGTASGGARPGGAPAGRQHT